MSRIKTRDNTNEIHVLKKDPRTAEQMRRALVRTRDSMRNQADESKESPNDYAEDRIKQNAENIASDAGAVMSTGVRTAAEAGKNEFKKRIQEKRKADVKTRDYVEAVAETERWETTEFESHPEQSIQSTGTQHRSSGYGRRDIKTAPEHVKDIKQAVKPEATNIKKKQTQVKDSTFVTERASNSLRARNQTVQDQRYAKDTSTKAILQAEERTRLAMEKAADNARKASAALKKLLQDISEATKAMIAAIGSLSGMAGVVIVLIVLIGLLLGSSYGIFFSNEKTDSNTTMQNVISEINAEYQGRIDAEKNGVDYDEVVLSGSRASWQDVLSIYAVLTTTDSANGQEVVTITPEKKQMIKDIFWAMTDISSYTDTRTETEIVKTDDGNGNILEDEQTKEIVTLHIVASRRTADEMAAYYDFNDAQLQLLNELQWSENAPLWRALLGRIYSSVAVDEEQIWTVLMENIDNPYGVAGLMGNLYAESGLNPMNLQSDYEISLGYTDESYTEAVDSGAYTRFGYDSAGYGLAQWTSDDRKQNLLAWCLSAGTSISDCGMQLDFLLYELEYRYPYVYEVLKNAGSIQEASNAVLHSFEAPLDQSAAVEYIRADYGWVYFDRYN